MAIIRANYRAFLSKIVEDADGKVADLKMVVDYVLEDDITGTREAAVSKPDVSVWDIFTPTQQANFNTAYQKAKTEAIKKEGGP